MQSKSVKFGLNFRPQQSPLIHCSFKM